MSTFQKLCEAVFAGKTIQYESGKGDWVNLNNTAARAIGHMLMQDQLTYRIKPDIKVITYRNYLRDNGLPGLAKTVELRICSDTNGLSQAATEIGPYFIKWLGDEQTIEVEV